MIGEISPHDLEILWPQASHPLETQIEHLSPRDTDENMHSNVGLEMVGHESNQSDIAMDEDGINAESSDLHLIDAEEENIVESGFGLCDKPHIGMEFQSEQEAFEYYKTYARKMGFGIRKDTLYRSKKTNRITSRKYVCCKEGYKEKDNRKPDVQNPRRHVREGCKALMGVRLSELNKWVVMYFVEEHTHEFVTPSKTGKLRSHRENCAATQSLITKFSETIGPSQITNVLNTLDPSGGATLTQQQTRDYLKKARRKTLGSECMHVVRSFKERHTKDVDFFFDMEIDEEYTMRSVFWVDGRSRRTYEKFGDVVVFDTTYKTNDFSMPFAPFTGVNHHGQSTLFGCGLLADETEETFVWLFETWLRAMHGKEPISIITDQCLAMSNAIKRVFPNTRHRYCSWHIGQNEIKHLNQIKIQNPGFGNDYSRCKYSKTTEEFEEKWVELIAKYKLEGNSWLAGMYDIRGQWIQCFLTDKFFAGMKTTQRSESMNAFFDGYVNAKTTLNEFVAKYDLALKSRREQESHEDHHTLYTRPILLTESPLELQAGNAYTRHVFERFQKQWKMSTRFYAKKCGEDGRITIYEVGDDDMKCMVKCAEEDGSATCSCKMFEFEGILCAHILKVYQKVDIMKIPSRYILTRWTIASRYGYVSSTVEFECNNAEYVTPMMIWSYREAALKCVELGIQSIDHYKIAMPALQNLLDSLANLKLSSDKTVTTSNVDPPELGDLSENIHMRRINDPSPSITVGRRKEKNIRIRSSIEGKVTKQRNCTFCHGLGHYRSTCPVLKAADH